MNKIILCLTTALLLTWNVSAQAQTEESSDAFFNGVTAYRAFEFEEAAEWFLKAAEQGDAEAQFLLGRMHFDGNSLSIDNVTAYMWFDIAAGNGLRAGMRYRDGMARKMTDDEVATARQRADQWRSKHPPSRR
ncbi:MAG: sel1 repeat family protein [Betaproteobacteria bacterium]|jgi:TPR repeat protein|nr:MAG: sel1 repeat family protein [Betaproteobacteria bacterium]